MPVMPDGDLITEVSPASEAADSYVPSLNETSPLMTRYERAKVLGLRTEQLARGAAPMLANWDAATPAAQLAREELRQRLTPFVVVRALPNGRKDFWKIGDMIVEGMS